jgi:hypothetical protein
MNSAAGVRAGGFCFFESAREAGVEYCYADSHTFGAMAAMHDRPLCP